MKQVRLGKTEITSPQNAFGALPIQRVSTEEAVKLARKAYDGGMTFFDTARAYSDSEEKLGIAFKGMRDKVTIASKTMARTPEDFWPSLETTLTNLQTDYVDLFQFHCVDQCYAPGDGTGMYECMLEAQKQGKIRHIGVTAHKLQVAYDCVESNLYETLQFPLSYLSSEKEVGLVKACEDHDMGFIAMKALAGGLLTNAEAIMAYIDTYDSVLPIWGIQRESELDQWLSYFENTPTMTPQLQAVIDADRKELTGNFCRGCGYCMPCPEGIVINQCARMLLMAKRAPKPMWFSETAQENMARIPECIHCGKCIERCPYGLDVPTLLEQNYEGYQEILRREGVIA